MREPVVELILTLRLSLVSVSALWVFFQVRTPKLIIGISSAFPGLYLRLPASQFLVSIRPSFTSVTFFTVEFEKRMLKQSALQSDILLGSILHFIPNALCMPTWIKAMNITNTQYLPIGNAFCYWFQLYLIFMFAVCCTYKMHGKKW